MGEGGGWECGWAVGAELGGVRGGLKSAEERSGSERRALGRRGGFFTEPLRPRRLLLIGDVGGFPLDG